MSDIRELFDQHVRAGERANRAQRLARTARTATARRKALAEVAEHEAERARIRARMDEAEEDARHQRLANADSEWDGNDTPPSLWMGGAA